MTAIKTLRLEEPQTDDPLAPVEGARRVWVDGRPGGWLMPPITQATAEASPGLQPWSHPRAKAGHGVRLDDRSSVLSFSDYCARHLIDTYPRSTRRPQ